MKPLYAAIAVAVTVAIVVAVCGPLVSYWLNGQNIVGDPQAAASYVGSVVGLLGAVLGASGAFVAYDLQRRDQRDLKAKTCAILIKIAMRPTLEEMSELFKLGLRAVGDDKKSFIGGKLPIKYELKPEKHDLARSFLARYMAIRTSLSLNSEAADALAHLDRKHVTLFLRANAFWERIRVDSTVQQEIEDFAYDFHWLEIAFDCILQFNHELNKIVLEADYLTSTTVTSTNAFLQHELPPLPV